jgi:iron(III)-enterobactin esterase
VRYAFVLLLLGCGDSPAAPPPIGLVDAGVAPDVTVAIDASPDTSTKLDCSRSAQARTAPTSLYDAFVKDAATASRVDKLLADVVAQGGTPLEQADDRLVFLVRGAPPQGPWSVAGSFTSWKPSQMTLVPGTDLYVLDTHVARGQAQPYKLLSGTADTGFTEDTLARNVVWDGVNHQTVGYFNAVAHPGDQDLAKGRLVRHRSVHATKLGDARDVFVYLPPRYDDGSCDALPHLVVHDGNEDLTRGDFMSVADATYTGTPSASAILAFVALPSQDVRMNQYTFGTQGAVGDDYGDFLLNDLEPMLAGAYRVCPSPVATGQAGASLGGLISTYLAFAHPEHWGYVGAQSASYFWNQNAMITRAGQDPKAAVRFYLDTGCPDDNCDVVRLMNTALVGKAYDVQYVEEAGAQHDWSYWAGRLPKLLLRFREGVTACR